MHGTTKWSRSSFLDSGARTDLAALVVAAQAGDRRALDELLTAHLPFVYTIVRRALNDHPDADDVVQNTMLRALRDLPGLRAADSFRAWLAAIAVRQVSSELHRAKLAARRRTTLENIAGTPDAEADVENLSILHLELSGQRRQVVRAARWLDPDDRALLSLWWLEVAGQLTRAELASALGVSVAHAGVRVQRMRGQLDLSRSVVAALAAPRTCPRLSEAISAWNRVPSPLWRKRVARHLRSCARCTAAASVQAGIVSHLVQALAAHPVTAARMTPTSSASAAGPPRGRPGSRSLALHSMGHWMDTSST